MINSATLEEKIYLILHLGEVNILGKRNKIRYSQIKILYQMHLYGKNIRNGKWKEAFPSVATIAKHTKLSKDTIESFICHPSFSTFGEKVNRKGTSNKYRLRKWVVDLFDFFERFGFMKRFQTNFFGWRQTFVKRIKNGVIPLVQQNLTLQQVMNKLSTRIPLKSVRSNPLKSVTTTPSGSTTPLGSKSNNERSAIPSVQTFGQLAESLRTRFLIRDGDVNMVMGRYSLNHHKKAMGLMDLWKSRGMQPDSPIQVYQACLNQTRAYRK